MAAKGELPVLKLAELVAADYSAKQYKAMAINGSGIWALASVVGQQVDGFLQNAPDNSSELIGDVMVAGISRAVLGGTVDEGDPLACDANGDLVIATMGDYVIARALEAGVDNDVVSVLITHEGVRPVWYQSFYIALASIADGDLLTGWTPGFYGTIEMLQARVGTPATTAAKASTLNLEIGTTNLTGGVLSLTSANMTPRGAIVDASAITAANEFSPSQTISVEAASTTTFIEGDAHIVFGGSVGAGF